MKYYKITLPKLPKLRKYMVVEKRGYYYVSIWRLWWPFYIVDDWDRFISVEHAIESLEEKPKDKYKTIKKL